MRNLSHLGRIFYGIAMAEMGFQTVYYHDFPYMLVPEHSWLPWLAMLAYVSGSFLILAGGGIALEKKTRPVSLLLAGGLLLIFCFFYIPYELIASSNYMHFGEWENAAKELALAGGALVIADGFLEKNENSFFRMLGRLAPLGSILFSLTICSFGVDHFLYAKEATGYMPTWVPYPMFFIYFTGAALMGSGIAIGLKIMPSIAAALLGTMIFTWFIILHIPKVIASPSSEIGGEVTSAFLALAYSGIAFVITAAAGRFRKIEQI